MIRKFLATLALAASLAFGAAPMPAQAAPAPVAVVEVAQFGPVQSAQQLALSDCWNGTVCLFAHANFGNPIWRQVTDEIPGCRSLVGTGWNNVTSSWANNYTFGVTFIAWDNANCTGDYLVLQGDYTQNLGGSSWNDKISAVEVVLS